MWQCQLSQPDCRCYRVDGYSLLKRLPLHPLIGPRCPVQSVGQWLDNIGLVQYENHLLSNGFDNVQFMVSVFSCGQFSECLVFCFFYQSSVACCGWCGFVWVLECLLLSGELSCDCMTLSVLFFGLICLFSFDFVDLECYEGRGIFLDIVRFSRKIYCLICNSFLPYQQFGNFGKAKRFIRKLWKFR